MPTYTQFAMRTLKPLGSDALDFAHAALGLVDEAYELALSTSEENALEEIGDLCWFLALAGKSLGVAPFDAERGMHYDQRASGTIGTMVEWLGEHAALIAGDAKKWLVYGKRPGESIEHRMARMVDLIRSIGEQHGWTLEEIQEANIRKLAARFPDGYTDLAAKERNKAAEMKALRRG